MHQAIAAIRFDPLLPVSLLAAVGVLCLLAVFVGAWRRGPGAGVPGTVLRSLAFALLLLVLSGPRLVQETREGLPDIGLLVVDQTASMQVGNRAALAGQARAELRDQAAKLPDLQ